MKQKLLDLQDDCSPKKRRVPTDVAEAVKFAQALLRSGAGNNLASSKDAPVVSDVGATVPAADLDKAKGRIA